MQKMTTTIIRANKYARACVRKPARSIRRLLACEARLMRRVARLAPIGITRMPILLPYALALEY